MAEVTSHSRVVGGSTAKRVINCPGSVALCATMPPKPSSKYADEGTLLHNIISEVLDKGQTPESFLGMKYEDVVFTQQLLEDKLLPALELLDEVDPTKEMEFAVETRVGFGSFLPDVFGSTDLLGRIGSKAIVLDWKFGDGVAVEAEEKLGSLPGNLEEKLDPYIFPSYYLLNKIIGKEALASIAGSPFI